MPRVSKKRILLVGVEHSPLIIGDLIDHHYHMRQLDIKSMEQAYNFQSARNFFGFVHSDKITSVLSLKHRKQ